MLGEHAFWITSRAAGMVVLLASSAAVAVGLLMGARLAGGRTAQLRVAHETLALAALVALAVHAGALLGDGFLSPSVADVTIPLVSSYHRIWTTTGIVAGWLLVILGLAFYVRGRIGVARWRRLHRWTALAWVLGVVHGLMEGTDSGTAWFLAAALAAILPAGALLATRLASAPRAGATA